MTVTDIQATAGDTPPDSTFLSRRDRRWQEWAALVLMMVIIAATVVVGLWSDKGAARVGSVIGPEMALMSYLVWIYSGSKVMGHRENMASMNGMQGR